MGKGEDASSVEMVEGKRKERKGEMRGKRNLLGKCLSEKMREEDGDGGRVVRLGYRSD